MRQDGIYARYEAQGLSVPSLVGTTTPQKVASAVLKAIREDRAEIIVSSQPIRPTAVLQAAAPQVIPRLAKRAGAHLAGGAGSRDETDRCRRVIMPDPAWLETGACPDRARAIPCKVRPVTGQFP